MTKFIAILLFVFSHTNCSEIAVIRKNFHEIDSKEQLYEFIEFTEKNYCIEVEPYLASAIMMKAEYVFFPHTKMKYFKNGKKRLETFINEHPDNLEAKYMRFLIQSEIPSFLNYNDNIESDFNQINQDIQSSTLPEEYKNVITTNINKINP